MAKQSSIFKLRGKADGQSFYYSKNGEYLTRKINPGMSSRVKTAEEYANTRLNNAEFGAAGACAGAMVKAVSSRWRYILNSIATGMLVKGIKKAIGNDTTHPWGTRGVLLADMPAIQALYNQFSKNEMPQQIVDFVNAKITSAGNGNALTISDDLEMNAETVEYLTSRGATGFILDVYCFGVSAPSYNAAAEEYAPVFPVIARFDGSAGAAQEDALMLGGHVYPSIPAVQNVDSAFGGVLVIFKPTKKVSDKAHVLQQHCSAYWHSVATTA